MKIEAESLDEYISKLPPERQQAYQRLYQSFDVLPDLGFQAMMQYNMPSYSVPLSTYPDGYHCQANTPLPFASLANQKNFIALYNMGLYAIPDLYDWFVQQYPHYSKHKLDMGKSCIRFKYMDDIPYELIDDLMSKVSAEQWIKVYEQNYKKK